MHIKSSAAAGRKTMIYRLSLLSTVRRLYTSVVLVPPFVRDSCARACLICLSFLLGGIRMGRTGERDKIEVLFVRLDFRTIAWLLWSGRERFGGKS